MPVKRWASPALINLSPDTAPSTLFRSSISKSARSKLLRGPNPFEQTPRVSADCARQNGRRQVFAEDPAWKIDAAKADSGPQDLCGEICAECHPDRSTIPCSIRNFRTRAWSAKDSDRKRTAMVRFWRRFRRGSAGTGTDPGPCPDAAHSRGAGFPGYRPSGSGIRRNGMHGHPGYSNSAVPYASF